MAQRDRTETVILVVVWVIPLLGFAWLLAAAGLPELAGVLLAIEAVIAALVYLAARPGQRPARTRPQWFVPVVMLGALGAVLGVTLLAVRVA